MLQADKADLKNQLKLRRLQIEEKELHFYSQSCSEVGTQAALLAGFAFGAITGVDIDADSSDAIQASWLFSSCMAMLLEIGVLVKTMQLSIRGPGLALRGPEGSVAHAIHVMREEYAYSKKLFYAGLFFFFVAVVVLVTTHPIDALTPALAPNPRPKPGPCPNPSPLSSRRGPSSRAGLRAPSLRSSSWASPGSLRRPSRRGTGSRCPPTTPRGP